MKKLGICLGLMFLCLCLASVNQVEAALVSFLSTDSFSNVDAVPGSWYGYTNANGTSLGTATLSLLSGYGTLTGSSTLTLRTTRGLGILGGTQGDEIDDAGVSANEYIRVTFTSDAYLNSLEVRSLFTNDGWSPGVEQGLVELYNNGGLVFSQPLVAAQSTGDGILAINYGSPYIVDELRFSIPSGLGATTSNSEFALARLNVDAAPVPEPATMVLLGTGILGLFGLRKKVA